MKPAVEQRLTAVQQQCLCINRVLLLLHAGRKQAARDLTHQLVTR